MTNLSDTCFIVVSDHELNEEAKDALSCAVKALGYDTPPDFIVFSNKEELSDIIFKHDPWAVVPVDEPSISAIASAFKLDANSFGVDMPKDVCGYTLVAVPGFEDCLSDETTKRVAWARLKAAAHPKF